MPNLTKQQKHICKFKKITYSSGNEMYFCTLPDCNKKINPKLALGKRCICWRCGDEFILTEYSLRLVKPHCNKCHKPKEEKIKKEVTPININHPIYTEDIKQAEMLAGPETSLAERLKQIVNQRHSNSADEDI